jgi:ABC-type transport system involved in multi-copper enzyme maturation permease subunit
VHLRLGPGPVFVYEWLTTTRRWQLYAIRAGFVSVLLVGMVLVWRTVTRLTPADKPVSIDELARFGQSLFMTIVSIELTLVLLLAPAATAGAICLDKVRGTLDHLLATDLSNSEIVLGKLGVRLVPILGLVASILPLVALSGLLGGIDPDALIGSFLTVIGCATVCSCLALAFSVWGRKTHEVLMISYLFIIVWVSSPLIVMLGAYLAGVNTPAEVPKVLLDSTTYSEPYYLVYAPYMSPGDVNVGTYLKFLGGCLCTSGMLVALATSRIRSVALRQAGQVAAGTWWARIDSRFRQSRWLAGIPGPSLDGNPVAWREWHRSKLSLFMRVVWFTYAAAGVLWITLALTLDFGGRTARGEAITALNTFQVLFGLLLLSVCAATSLAEERVRGSLEILLSTPLSTSEILAGKWLGSFRLALRVLFWPVVLGGVLLSDGGHWLGYLVMLGLISGYLAGISSLGLAIATWVRRVGQAVTICISATFLFAIGWVILVVVSVTRDPLGMGLVMGSPLYGAPLATLLVASGENLAGVEHRGAMLGALCWTLMYAGAALGLFACAVATFDACLGRMPESGQPPSVPEEAKKLSAADVEAKSDDWLDDDLLPVGTPPSS